MLERCRPTFLLLIVLVAVAGAGSSEEVPRPRQELILERLDLSADRALTYEPPELITTARSPGQRTIERCGTAPLATDLRDSFDSAMAGWHTAGSESQKQAKMKVPVVFWVIENRSGRGAVSDAQLFSQLDLLNWAYRKSGITFTLHSGWRVSNSKYHTKCNIFKKSGKISGVYKSMTKKLTRAGKIDPARTVNVYICQPRGGSIGQAFAAQLLQYPQYDEGHHVNGVVVDHRTLPGGDLYPYNSGATVAHEIGHYFGLYHTFSPWEIPGMTGCDFPGDLIDDTPYERSPAYEAVPENNCAKGRDTCPDLPRKDPVTNFMDYSSDYCVRKFTNQQKRMMQDVIEVFRPSLMH